MAHARRWLIPCTACAWATAARRAAGVTIFCGKILEHRVVEHRFGQQTLRKRRLATAA
jgi:hypothetical protein